MRIALINEDSQADKNKLIAETLCAVADKYGNTVDNYGMYAETDPHQINYIQVGVIASVILETGMADFVVTGCGTGQGAMISCNAFLFFGNGMPAVAATRFPGSSHAPEYGIYL